MVAQRGSHPTTHRQQLEGGLVDCLVHRTAAAAAHALHADDGLARAPRPAAEPSLASARRFRLPVRGGRVLRLCLLAAREVEAEGRDREAVLHEKSVVAGLRLGQAQRLQVVGLRDGHLACGRQLNAQRVA